MRILDLFAGAGGATRGYQLAFPDAHITGVDIAAQPRYCGDEFVQGDALTFPLDGFDLIHASPPCQRYSAMSGCRPGLGATYPDLIAATRERLAASGIPYVIENVVGAPLIDPVMLCGQMFGLELYRHRLFETTFPVIERFHPAHVMPASRAGHWKPGTVMSVAGHVAPIAKAREVMGIDWMTRTELTEAIPPAFTEYIGGFFHKGTNVQTWDAVLALPWPAAFAMSCPPQPAEPAVVAPPACDGRPMVAVVEAMCSEVTA